MRTSCMRGQWSTEEAGTPSSNQGGCGLRTEDGGLRTHFPMFPSLVDQCVEVLETSSMHAAFTYSIYITWTNRVLSSMKWDMSAVWCRQKSWTSESRWNRGGGYGWSKVCRWTRGKMYLRGSMLTCGVGGIKWLWRLLGASLLGKVGISVRKNNKNNNKRK